MNQSLLIIPDISGFTNFVQTTEISHSQHVIAELLEVLLAANRFDLQLAEVEGDALFLYKENQILDQKDLLAQIEALFRLSEDLTNLFPEANINNLAIS